MTPEERKHVKEITDEVLKLVMAAIPDIVSEIEYALRTSRYNREHVFV